jgi:hypothetical protein
MSLSSFRFAEKETTSSIRGVETPHKKKLNFPEDPAVRQQGHALDNMDVSDSLTAEEVHLIKSFMAMMKSKSSAAFDRLVKPDVQDCASQTRIMMVEQEVQTDNPTPVEKPRVTLRFKREVEEEIDEEIEEEEEESEAEEGELDMEEEIATFQKLVRAYKNKNNAGLTRSRKDRISTDLRDFARKHNITNSGGFYYKSYHPDMIMKLNHRFGLEGDRAVR